MSDTLAPEKREAITTTEGPVLIIAGPGAGKTRTLVERILYLLTEKGARPGEILVATFTDKAARELTTRLSNRLLEAGLTVNLHDIYLGTLHGLFLRLLEENREYTRLRKNYRFLEAFDQHYFLYQRLDDFRAIDGYALLVNPLFGRWPQAKRLSELVNQVSEEYLDLPTLLAAPEPEVRALGSCTALYRQQLAEENALDFSSIQSEALYLLESQPMVLTRLQAQLRYLMVDEYQDTNTVQELILLKLAGKRANLCVVGDDDQGLYRFRGATVRNILEFPSHFAPGQCRQVRLTTNFRSHPGIIDFYNRWMQRQQWQQHGSTFRFAKTIQPRPAAFRAMSTVVRVGAKGPDAWHAEILRFLRTLEQDDVITDFNQVAFLFRSVRSREVSGLANYLEAHGVPVYSPRSALFFEREEVQLVLGALVFVFSDLFEQLRWNDAATLPVWDYYQACKLLFATHLRADPARHAGLLLWCQRTARAHLTLDRPTNYAFSGLFYNLLQFPLFAPLLAAELWEGPRALRPSHNLALLSRLIARFEELHNVQVITPKTYQWALRRFFNHYLRFLHEGGLEEYEGFEEAAPSGYVSFLTIHQSKGMEFPVVVAGALHGAPRKDYSRLTELLHARYTRKRPYEPLTEIRYFDFYRLYYTAFSRAQNLLVLTAPERSGRGANPSRWFREVYEQVPRWQHEGFDHRQLILDDVKPVSVKYEYAFTSDILLYENCPRQYKFFRELGFATVRSAGPLFGTLVHQTIEDMHKAVLLGQPETVTPARVAAWFEANYQSLRQALNTYLAPAQLEAARRQVLAYERRHHLDWSRLQQAEVDVSLVKPGYILKGTIDLLRGTGDTVEVVDFKTDRKPDVNHPDDQRRLARYQRQLEVYAYLVEQRLGLKVSRLHLYYTAEKDGNPYVSFDYLAPAIEATIEEFERVVDKIEHQDFDMHHVRKSEALCKNCDMRFFCHPNYPQYDR